MPALDRCHPIVERALQKEGAVILNQPLTLKRGKRRTFIDIEAAFMRNGSRRHVFLIEVKCFPNEDSITTETYIAIGQYLVYRAFLKELNITSTLYLSIPHLIYEHHFDSTLRLALVENHIHVVLVNLDEEAIVSWIEF